MSGMRHFANVQIYQAVTMDGRHSMEHLKKQVKVNIYGIVITGVMSSCEIYNWYPVIPEWIHNFGLLEFNLSVWK